MFRMRLIIYMAVMQLSYESQATLKMEEILDISSKLCPYTSFCSRNPAKLFNESLYERGYLYGPCCTQCSCDDDCWETSNCCPDKNRTGDTKTRYFEDVCMDSMVEKVSHKSQGAKVFRVVNKCRNFTVNRNHTIRCENESSSVEDFLWVSDPDTGRIFKNWHCAICNDVNNYDTWHIRTNCEGVIIANLVNLSSILMSNSCRITNEPPKHLEYLVTKYICYDEINKYSNCKASGEGIAYDAALKNLCDKYIWPFDDDGRVSKNAFCYICNGVKESALPKICKKYERRVLYSEISILLDFDKVQTSSDELVMQNPVCAVEEIFDKFMNHCRAVTCPFGRIPRYGKCLRMAVQIDSLNVVVAFNITIISNDTMWFQESSNNDFMSLGNITFHKILMALGVLEKHCDYCLYTLRTVWDKKKTYLNGFIFWSFLRTRHLCSYDFLLGQSQKVVREGMQVELNRSLSATLLFIVEKRSYDAVEKESGYFIEENNSCPDWIIGTGSEKYTAEVRVQNEMTCPQIKLRFGDVNKLKSKLQVIGFASFFNAMDIVTNDTTVKVCAENYFAIMQESSFVSSTRAFSVQHITLLLLAAVTCYLV